MKHFRKSLLTLLALTLFGGAGAWAQTDYYVVGTFNSWSQNDSYKMTYTDYVNAYTFTLDLSTSDQVKVASFDGSSQFYPDGMGNAYGENGEIPANGTYTIYFKPEGGQDGWYGGYFKVESGTLPDPPATSIRLTPDATGKVWTLAETPDYDLDLKVVYYQKYALKNIPANWQVKVDGVDKTDAIDHDSLKITETDQVLLTPDHPERVKKVMLVDPTITVDGVTLFGAVGMTWNDIAALNDNMTIDGTLVKYQNSVLVTPGPLAVYPTAQYDPSNNYSWWTGN